VSVLCEAVVLLCGRWRRDNTGRGELIAVETASFVHSDGLNRNSAQPCTAIVVKTRFCSEHEGKSSAR